jgi:phage terminase small subunit
VSLTKRQIAFIEAYLHPLCQGQADAARKAGFSIKRAKVTAAELMRNPEVKQEIDRRLAAKVATVETRAKDKKVNRESLCAQCNEVIEKCTQAGAGAWQMQSRLKAIELKAKLHGLLTEKVELGLDEKLIQLLEAGRKRVGLPPKNEPPIAPAVVVEPAIKGELIART